jgi:hypothetical protein
MHCFVDAEVFVAPDGVVKPAWLGTGFAYTIFVNDVWRHRLPLSFVYGDNMKVVGAPVSKDTPFDAWSDDVFRHRRLCLSLSASTS